jgi:predicted amidohydrolase YtcJ
VPSEAIDVETALLAYTNGVAYQAGQVLDWGLVRINGRADLTLLADDPRAVDPADLGKIEIEGTWLAGEQVWG